ncbi:hypothetical protein HDU77_003731 [Chytriomyces hyalinus]|nr:hypothetical protein HDU77_003731 [Chytriomyces hyalinus]
MAKSCGKWSADQLPYISTAYTARDMSLIREALKEPLTRIFGGFGTFLGIAYANMFPDRVGREGDIELSAKERIEAYFKSLTENPPILVDAAVTQAFEATDAISVLFQAMYSPKSWKTVADAFASAIYDGNATSLAKLQKQNLDEKDACPFKDNSGMFMVSSLRNAMMDLEMRTTVLLIGNTFDPVTPLKSAKLAESLMGGNGRLLTHNAYGHCSLGQFGACTMGYVREFFTTGSYPAPGTVCNLTKEEENPFLQQTILSAAGIKSLDQASKWNLDDLAKELEAVQAFLAHTNFKR